MQEKQEDEEDQEDQEEEEVSALLLPPFLCPFLPPSRRS